MHAVHNCNGVFSAWSPVYLTESHPLDNFSSSGTPSSLPLLSMSLNTTLSSFPPPRTHNFTAPANSSSLTTVVGARVMAIWAHCALVRACVCPKGSSRRNHRQDQAALTLALACQGVRCYDSDTVKPSDNHLELNETTRANASDAKNNHSDWYQQHHSTGHERDRQNGTTFVIAHGNTLRSCADNDPLCYLKKHAPECLREGS